VAFLIDTNIVSELRRGAAADAGVVEWFDRAPTTDLYLSVVTVGEIRQGVEQLRARQARKAADLDRWLSGLLEFYEDRLIHIDGVIAEEWGRLRAKRPVPVVDAFLAATARVHDFTLVTRNTSDFAGLGVACENPFKSGK
jgi:predicted nucleic acid-binding protein